MLFIRVTFNSYINHQNSRYITEILPIWRKTQLNNNKGTLTKKKSIVNYS